MVRSHVKAAPDLSRRQQTLHLMTNFLEGSYSVLLNFKSQSVGKVSTLCYKNIQNLVSELIIFQFQETLFTSNP